MKTLFLQVLIFIICCCSSDNFGSEAVKLAKEVDALKRFEGLIEFVVNKTETLESDLATERAANEILANKNDLLEEQVTLLSKQNEQLAKQIIHL